MEASNNISEIDSRKASSRFLTDIENELLLYIDKDEYEISSNKIEFVFSELLKLDPTPATPTNEYFDKIIERTEFSLRNYLSAESIDARGDIYRKYGEPTFRQDFLHPNYRTECWMYKNLSSKDVFFDFIFSTRIPQWMLVKNPNDLKLNRDDDFYSKKGEIKLNKPFLNPSNTFFEDRSNISSYYNEMYINLYQLYHEKTSEENSPRSYDIQAESMVRTHLIDEVNKQTVLPKSIIQMNIPTIEFAKDICRFKIDNETIKVENYIGFPIWVFEKTLNQNISQHLHLNATITLKDVAYSPLHSIREKIDFSFDDPGYANFIDMISLNLPATNFLLAIEAQEKDSLFNIILQHEIKTGHFLSSELFLSNIQSSLSITESDEKENKFYKNGLLISPYPYYIYPKDRPFFIYFEI